MNLKSRLYLWLQKTVPTIGQGKYIMLNPWIIIRNKGVLKLSNGYSINFNKENKKDIFQAVGFALVNGIRFGEDEYSWKLDEKKGIIETHQGIKFKISAFGLLDETFLSQIHFSGFDIKNKTVLTAGAYIGDTPLFYSYYGAKVFAFEPDPNSFKKAIENIDLNPNLKDKITLKNYAIGQNGEVDFPIEQDSGGSSIFETSNKKTIKVKSKSIRDILNEFNILNPFLLDLDIKGSEFDVILDDSISKFKRVRIEYSPYLVKDPTKSLKFLIDKLKEYGFNSIRIYKHNNLRFDLTDHGTLEAEK